MRFMRITAMAAVGTVLLATQAAPAWAQSSSLCGYTNSEIAVSQGSMGVVVRQAQCELNWAYQYPRGPLAVDGSFGPATRDITIAFQRCVGLSLADGAIGAATWSKLDYWVKQPTFACPP
jgi:peptidoglycan hydrolase-like protein with peptidoglycan-binding domain